MAGATLLVLLHVAIGARFRRALGARDAPEATWRWPVDAALGAGVLATVLLALGAAGLLRSAIVLGVTVALAIVARRELLVAARELAGLPRFMHASGRAAAYARVLLGALVLLLVAAAVAPATEWDSLMYHLRIPLWMLEQGRLAVPPDSFHVALVGGAHFSTLPLLAAGITTGPALMQVAALALTLTGTVALARAVGASRGGGWLAVAMVLGSPVFVLVAITARVDVALVLSLVAAHLALLAAAGGPADAAAEAPSAGDRRTLVVAALLVGSSMAIKPHAGAYALMLVPLGWRAARGMRPALTAAAIAALTCLPWYLKNHLLVGAPLYPIGAPGWFEPWIAALFNTTARPDSVDASVLRALPEARGSFNVSDAFLAPERLTIEGEGAFYALSPVLMLLPLALFAYRHRPRALGLAIVGLGYALLVVVPFGRINLRYLMPALPVLAVAVATGIESLASRAGARVSAEMRTVLGIVLLVTALLPLTGTVRQRFLVGDQVLVRHALGITSAQDVWRRHPDGTARSFAPVVMNVRRLVPEDGKVLMLWEARGLPFGREVLVDVMLSNWSFVAQSGHLDDCLAGTGITHILTGSGSVEYYVGRGADPRAFLLDRFAPFRERCLVRHTVVGPGFDLFTLRRVAP